MRSHKVLQSASVCALAAWLVSWLGVAQPAWAFREPEAPAAATPTGQPILRPQDLPPAPDAHKISRLLRAEVGRGLRAEEALVDAVLTFLEQAPEFWADVGGGLPLEALRVSYVKLVPATAWTRARGHVEFTQVVEDLEVIGTYVRVGLTDPDGRALLTDIAANVYPTLALPPRTPQPEAIVRAKARETLGLSLDAPLRREERVIQYLRGPDGLRWREVYRASSAQKRGFLAVVDLGSLDTALIDARLYAIDRPSRGVRDAPPEGTEGRVRGRGVLFDPLATGENLDYLPLKDLAVTQTGSPPTSTDAEGLFHFSPLRWTTPDGPTLTATLSGHWADVTSAISPTLSFSEPVTPGSWVEVLLNPVGAEEDPTAQVNGYYHTTYIHDYSQSHLAGALPEIDIPLPVNVNIQSNCNAFYSFGAPSINFYHAGGDCLNTAYDTVIYHEYGHFVDDMAGPVDPLSFPAHGLSEGWGDVLACYASGQPLIGEGFYGPMTFVRTCDNDYQFPLEGFDEVHALGQAWAGFAWHLRENLIARYGEAEGIAVAEKLILPVVLADPQDIPQAVTETLLRDDDDGDLTNGTPHIAQIAQAAYLHRLAAPVTPIPLVALLTPPGDVAPGMSMDLFGTADSTLLGLPFAQYALFYGVGADPIDWVPIGGPHTTPVVAGLLGIWDTTSLPVGLYTVRLVVTTTVPGIQFEDTKGAFITEFPAQPITTDPYNQSIPAIAGDRIVWQDFRHGNPDIYLYDLATGTETQITTDPSSQWLPAIAGDRIVWEDDRHGNLDIYLYDLATGSEIRLTIHPASQSYPAIAGDRIIWQDRRHGNWDIYFLELER